MSRKPADVASKERNEYIPSFIAKKPFYIDDESTANDYLEHQRLQKQATDQSNGTIVGSALVRQPPNIAKALARTAVP